MIFSQPPVIIHLWAARQRQALAPSRTRSGWVPRTMGLQHDLNVTGLPLSILGYGRPHAEPVPVSWPSPSSSGQRWAGITRPAASSKAGWGEAE